MYRSRTATVNENRNQDEKKYNFIKKYIPASSLSVSRDEPIHAGPSRGGGGGARGSRGMGWAAWDQCQAPAVWTAWPVRSCSASRATLCASHATHEGNVEPWAQRSIFAETGKLDSAGSR